MQMAKILYIFFLISFVLSFNNDMSGQSSYRATFGMVVGNNGDLSQFKMDGEKKFRIGYQAGLNANFGTYNLIISPGIYYRNITLDNNFEKLDPFVKSPRLNIIRSKAVLSYQTDIGTKRIKLRIGGGLNGSYIVKIDSGYDKNYEILRDSYYGYNLDLGLDFYFLTFGVSYEKTLIDIISSDSIKSKFDAIEMSVGIIL